MIKLFRKVRQKLIEEKKLTNYLLYAIGEIILVVIGILIALQINTANQNRQQAKLEKVLLKQVKFELQDTYEDIWRDIARLEMGEKSHYNILQYFNENKPYSDELCFDFHWLQLDEYIYPTNAAYTRLKEKGLDLIDNDIIRSHLQELYESHFPRLMKNNAFTRDISNVFSPYYLEAFEPNTNLDLKFKFQLTNDTVGQVIYTNQSYNYPQINTRNDQAFTIGYVPLHFEAIKKDPKFKMLMNQTTNDRNYKLRRYIAASIRTKEVVRMINRVLN